MSNTQLSVKNYFDKDQVKEKFQELLGEKSTAFVTSVLQVVSSNNNLANAEPSSVFNAAAMAAVLDMPINSNLGMAYIVPYQQSFKNENGQWQKKQVAQFQIGYKGFIQLAIRSGQYETISSAAIHEGQLVSNNPLTGFKFDFNKPSKGKIVGYASYFKLKDGFTKTFFMTSEQMQAHGKKYSKSYDKEHSIWKKDFESMAMKTVLKLLISKYGPMSLEMQKAVISDQAVVNNFETDDVTYPETEKTPPENIMNIEGNVVDENDDLV